MWNSGNAPDFELRIQKKAQALGFELVPQSVGENVGCGYK